MKVIFHSWKPLGDYEVATGQGFSYSSYDLALVLRIIRYLTANSELAHYYIEKKKELIELFYLIETHTYYRI